MQQMTVVIRNKRDRCKKMGIVHEQDLLRTIAAEDMQLVLVRSDHKDTECEQEK